MSTDRKGLPHLPLLGKRPSLTTAQILGWADAYHATHGRWPTIESGPVVGAPSDENWRAVDKALRDGFRGLSGGQSLAGLLRERRGAVRPPRGERAPAAAVDVKPARKKRRRSRPNLSVEQVLAWADAHHAATGRWPTAKSGPIAGAIGETWGKIHSALRYAIRGLPGSTTLRQFLFKHRGRQARNAPPDLSVEQVLGWADEFHRTHGRWPSLYDRGAIPGSGGESWTRIHNMLSFGRRGLPGRTTLSRFLAEHRAPQTGKRPARLSIPQILRWADAYHEKHGRWPRTKSGAVAGTESESWYNINTALNYGLRGLPGGSSLCRLLAEHRRVRNPKAAPALSIEQILRWADAHREATGKLPRVTSGAVQGANGERWSSIDWALKNGLRGLPGGWTLRRLLNAKRSDRGNWLTLEQVRAWGESHRAVNGEWPRPGSGPVAGAPGESWQNINDALFWGCRGLPGGMTLGELFGYAVRRRRSERCPRLGIPQILAWADAHRAATGRWPAARSGPVHAAPFLLTWSAVDSALAWGSRGLAGGQSLARLLQKHRGHPPRMGVEGAGAREAKLRAMTAQRGGRDSRTPLTINRILAAVDEYYAANGRWPDYRCGPVTGLPGDTWATINRALVRGRRGLPGGTSLAQLLRQYRGRYCHGLITLSVEQILEWADAYHEGHGRWPNRYSGRVDEASPDTWDNINKVLARGVRGLPGGTTLSRLLAEHRGARSRGTEPDLTAAQILAWAQAHHTATGAWPTTRSGRVSAAPEENWWSINYALRKGRRGLPGGSSLADFLAEQLPVNPRVLTIEKIVAWGEAHYAIQGRWPGPRSGAVIGVPGEKWANIEQALRFGGRGLSPGLCLSTLFDGRKAPDSGPGS
jgi:hypothetical protein